MENCKECKIKNHCKKSEKTVVELINELPEIIFCNGKKTKAFLEITKDHVYYCTKHDNRGNCNCVFVSLGKGKLLENLQKAVEWIKEGVDKNEIIIVE